MKSMNQLKYRIIFSLLFLAIGTLTTQATNDEHGIIAAKELKIPIYRNYRMYVKKYNKATQEHIAKGERIVLRYSSANESVIEPKGNAFKSVGKGKTELTLRISSAYPGTLDAFDPDHILDEMKFMVEVDDHVDMTFPQFSASWGEKKAKTMDDFLKSGAYTKYTEEYWTMNPKVSEEEREGLEILSTNNAEFPFMMLAFTPEENELCAIYLLAASWERVTTPQVSEVYKLFTANGFLDRGTNPDTRCWQMYNPESKTLATCGLMIVQGCGYCYVSLSYLADDPSPSGIYEVRAEQPKVSCQLNNGILNVQADDYIGESLAIYSFDGKCLKTSKIKAGNNIILDLPHQPFFVRVGSCAAIKVMP